MSNVAGVAEALVVAGVVCVYAGVGMAAGMVEVGRG